MPGGVVRGGPTQVDETTPTVVAGHRQAAVAVGADAVGADAIGADAAGTVAAR